MFACTKSSRSIVTASRRWHSSSSWPPQKDNGNQNGNQNNELEATEEEALATTSKDLSRTAEVEALKKRISVRAQSLDFSLMRPHSVPSVPSTQYLDVNTVKRDMFFTGFRPILTPVRRPVARVKKQPTKALGWNESACSLETFDDFSKVPQFIADKLVPFKEPSEPGNEVRVGYKSRKEEREMQKLSMEVADFIKHFRN